MGEGQADGPLPQDHHALAYNGAEAPAREEDCAHGLAHDGGRWVHAFGDGDDPVRIGDDVLGAAAVGAAGGRLRGWQGDHSPAGRNVGAAALLDHADDLVAGDAGGQRILLLRRYVPIGAHVGAADGEALSAHEHLALAEGWHGRVHDFHVLRPCDAYGSHGMPPGVRFDSFRSSRFFPDCPVPGNACPGSGNARCSLEVESRLNRGGDGRSLDWNRDVGAESAAQLGG